MMSLLGRLRNRPLSLFDGGVTMCYKFYVPKHQELDHLDEILEYLESRNVLVKTGNVTPGDVAAVIANSRELRPQPFGMLWGYRLSNGKLVYNARSETASEKALFADGMRQRRCLIPAAHYYEWQRAKTGSQPYLLHPKGETEMLMAGIYRFEGNQPVFSILTRTPPEQIAHIHDRMPVILPREALSDWLNPKYRGEEILKAAVTAMEFCPC